MKKEFFIFILILILLIINSLLFYHQDTDDAYISFRYAKNLYNGWGLVFNKGEKVEGYTNFLWTILMSISFLLKLKPLILARILSFISIIIFLFFLLNQKKILNNLIYYLIFTLSLHPAIGYWLMLGMETIFFMTFINLFIFISFYYENKNILIIFLALISSLTRPEGLFIVSLTFLIKFFINKNNRIKILKIFLVFISIYGIYFLWRFSYYNSLLPNTFYAKVSGGASSLKNGFHYIMKFIKDNLLFYILLIPYLFNTKEKRNFIFYIFSIVILIIYHLYVLVVGGDWMALYRFFIPILPLILFLNALSLKSLRKKYKILAFSLTILQLVYLFYIANPYYIDNPIFTGKPKVDLLKEIGLWLKINAQKNDVIAVIAAGKIPYYSDLKTIDMRGLVDKHIARLKMYNNRGLAGHFKRDPKYVLSKKPKYIITTGAIMKKRKITITKGKPPPLVLDSYPILKLKEFKKYYKPLRIKIPYSDKDILIYIRKNNLKYNLEPLNKNND